MAAASDVLEIRATQLQPSPTAPAEARRWTEWMREWMAPERWDDLQIVVSELVSNSVLHAGLQAGQRIRIRAAIDDTSVELTVTDHGIGIPADVSAGLPETAQAGRRGMFLIHRLSRRVAIDAQAGRVTCRILRDGLAGPSASTEPGWVSDGRPGPGGPPGPAPGS